MISIGGIIGAGLFVSSSTSIIAGGPASFISYAICGLLILLVMRMLAEMALPKVLPKSHTVFIWNGNPSSHLPNGRILIPDCAAILRDR
jgi:L-asparagine transporter-like permease